MMMKIFFSSIVAASAVSATTEVNARGLGGLGGLGGSDLLNMLKSQAIQHGGDDFNMSAENNENNKNGKGGFLRGNKNEKKPKCDVNAWESVSDSDWKNAKNAANNIANFAYPLENIENVELNSMQRRDVEGKIKQTFFQNEGKTVPKSGLKFDVVSISSLPLVLYYHASKKTIFAVLSGMKQNEISDLMSKTKGVPSMAAQLFAVDPRTARENEANGIVPRRDLLQVLTRNAEDMVAAKTGGHVMGPLSVLASQVETAVKDFVAKNGINAERVEKIDMAGHSLAGQVLLVAASSMLGAEKKFLPNASVDLVQMGSPASGDALFISGLDALIANNSLKLKSYFSKADKLADVAQALKSDEGQMMTMFANMFGGGDQNAKQADPVNDIKSFFYRGGNNMPSHDGNGKSWRVQLPLSTEHGITHYQRQLTQLADDKEGVVEAMKPKPRRQERDEYGYENSANYDNYRNDGQNFDFDDMFGGNRGAFENNNFAPRRHINRYEEDNGFAPEDYEHLPRQPVGVRN